MVPEGKYLLVKNKLKTTDSGNTIFNQVLSKLDDDKALYIKHKPNRNIFVLGRFHLGMYNFFSSKSRPEKNETNKLRKFFRERGEAPVLLDTNEILKSEANLKNYLFSKGYYNCEISHAVKYGKKKAVVTYYIIPNHPYLIEKVNLSADDAEIDELLNSNLDSTLFIKGQPIEVEVITTERNRISNVLRNRGYFEFSKDYLDFELDTNIVKHTVIVNISVANKTDNERFMRKTIRHIDIYFENDSETYKEEPPVRFKDITFHFNGFPINPDVIAKNITIKEGDIFKIKELENTYAKLSEFPIFKFIDINYFNTPEDSINGLNAMIILKTNYRQSFTIEPQTIMSQLNRIQNINYGNSYGMANSMTWAHRNLFRNAEVFEVNSNTRLETQLYRDTNTGKLKYFNPAIQQSFSMSLSIPKSSLLGFLQNQDIFKGRLKNLYLKDRIKSIKTNIILSFLFEKNPDYLRRILPLTYQYQIQTRTSTWYFNLFEMSFSKNTLDIDISNRTDGAFIRRLFTNSLITSTSLSVLYTNKNTTTSKSYFFIRSNIFELSGNIHRGIRKLIDTDHHSDTSYKLLNVNYYNYAKSEIDVRCSTVLSENYSTVLRFNIGAAYPYGNQKVTPFDRLFFIGGANSLRAWRPRTIGPGAYYESSKNFRIDRAGDLILLSNAELRMDLIDKKIEGAIFLDAGNVWLIRNYNNPDPLKLFKLRSFLSEIGINTGVGFRFDFQFFLFRVDWGMQIHNPEKPIGQTWVIKEFAKNNYFTKYSIVNFGIGYPF